MSSDLGFIVQIGNDTMASKYYAIAAGTILFYDYLLTLEDEVKYAWSGRKSWTFWLFVVNRYFPMTWPLWELAVAFVPRSRVTVEICKRTSFYGTVMFIICTLLAQTVLTIRIYAATMRNKLITAAFATMTAAQCVLGICMIVLTAREGALLQLPLPFDAYQVCVFAQPNRRIEVAYTSLSLLYDSIAFSLVIFLTRQSKVSGLKVWNILDTIAVDAAWYFMVIFCAHLTLLMTLCLGRITIQLLPGAGINVYIPLMVSRIMLSLRKAADPSQAYWSLVEPTAGDAISPEVLKFAPRYWSSNGEEDDTASFDSFSKV